MPEYVNNIIKKEWICCSSNVGNREFDIYDEKEILGYSLVVIITVYSLRPGDLGIIEREYEEPIINIIHRSPRQYHYFHSTTLSISYSCSIGDSQNVILELPYFLYTFPNTPLNYGEFFLNINVRSLYILYKLIVIIMMKCMNLVQIIQNVK